MAVAARSLANLRPAWKPGESGNPRGTNKSVTTLIKEALDKTELCDQPVPGGRTAAEALAESMISHAIKGNGAYMKEIMDRVDGKLDANSSLDERAGGPQFQIHSNGRGPNGNAIPRVQAEPGTDPVPDQSC